MAAAKSIRIVSPNFFTEDLKFIRYLGVSDSKTSWSVPSSTTLPTNLSPFSWIKTSAKEPVGRRHVAISRYEIPAMVLARVIGVVQGMADIGNPPFENPMPTRTACVWLRRCVLSVAAFKRISPIAGSNNCPFNTL